MTRPLRLVLALHNHQPVGNFDGVFADAFRDSYSPFLDVLDEFPEDVSAMNDLGYMYRQGWGVPQTYSEALHWFRKAAERYDSYAEYNMGQMFENGWGVEKDMEEGIRWFRRSAARGHEWAAKRLEELGVKT